MSQVKHILDNFVDRWLGFELGEGKTFGALRAFALATMGIAVFSPIILPLVLAGVFGFKSAALIALFLSAVGFLVFASLRRFDAQNMKMTTLSYVLIILTGLVCFYSNGITSPFIMLMLLIPFEAIHSRKPLRFIVGLAAVSILAMFILYILSNQVVAPISEAGSYAGALLCTALYLVSVVAREFYSGAKETPLGGSIVSLNKNNDTMLEKVADIVTFHKINGSVTKIAGGNVGDFSARININSAKEFFNRIHVSDQIDYMQAFDRLKTGSKEEHLVVRMVAWQVGEGDEQFVHFKMRLVAEHDDKGVVMRVLGFSEDITKSLINKSNQEKLIEKANNAEATKLQFLACVSHELRTPLNAILGFSDALLQGYVGKFADERQREYMQLVHDSGQHLLGVVNTMLDVGKIKSGKYQIIADAFSIAKTVDNTVSMLKIQAAEKGITLNKRVAKSCPEIIADEKAIQQILINLVSNGIKFSENNGIVNVDIEEQGDDMLISVSDNGIGMSAEEIAIIGEPFVQIDNDYTRRFEGSGLGLSLVKGLVCLHGGKFEITSALGEGTTVRVTLALNGEGINNSAKPESYANALIPFKAPEIDTEKQKNKGADHARSA